MIFLLLFYMSNQDPAQQSAIQETEVSSSFLSPIMDLPILHKIIYIGSFIIAIILLVILIFAISKNGFAGMFQKNIEAYFLELHKLLVEMESLYKKPAKDMDENKTIAHMVRICELCKILQRYDVQIATQILAIDICFTANDGVTLLEMTGVPGTTSKTVTITINDLGELVNDVFTRSAFIPTTATKAFLYNKTTSGLAAANVVSAIIKAFVDKLKAMKILNIKP